MTLRKDWEPHVDEAAQKYGVPRGIIAALIEQENGGGRDTSTSVGYGKKAYGIGQFLLPTAREHGYQGDGSDLGKPEVGIPLVAKKLREDYARLGSWPKVAANWYGGGRGVRVYGTPAGATRHIMSKETGAVSSAPSINEYVASFANHARNYGVDIDTPELTPDAAGRPMGAGGGMQAQLASMFGLNADLIPPQIRAMFPQFPNLAADPTEPNALANIKGEIDNPGGLREQLKTQLDELKKVLESGMDDYASKAGPGANPGLRGLGSLAANIASALSGNDRYALENTQARNRFDAERQQRMLQARGEALQMSLERWTHIRDRLEAKQDQYNALLANEKVAKAAQELERWKTEYAAATQMATAAINQQLQSQGELARTLASKGIVVGTDPNGNATVAMTAKEDKPGTPLQSVKDAEETTLKAIELVNDKRFEKGDANLMAKGVVVRTWAAWRTGDIATSAANRLQANKTAIAEMFGNDQKTVDAVMQVAINEQIREEALRELNTGEKRVPGIVDLARANGLLPQGPGAPEPTPTPKTDAPAGETAAQKAERLAQAEIDAQRKKTGQPTDRDTFMKNWPPQEPNLDGTYFEDVAEQERYWKEVYNGWDSAKRFGLGLPEEATSKEFARKQYTSYKREREVAEEKRRQEQIHQASVRRSQGTSGRYSRLE